VRYEVGLFAEGEPLSAACGHFVHVYVDRQTRRPVPLPDALKTHPGDDPMTPRPPCQPARDRRPQCGRRHHQPPVGPRLPAHAGAARHAGAHPARGQPRTVGHQHAALEGLCAAGRQPRQRWSTRSAPRTTRCAPIRRWPEQYREEYDYYPEKWVSPYIDRRRENGWGLYGLLGIGKGDKDKMHAQHQRNFRFFDAPVGLMFTLDKVMGRGSLVDYGMFLQNIMVAARGQGLHTCPQAAWNGFAKIILPHIGAGGRNAGLRHGAGLADPADPVNGFHTPREPVASFTHLALNSPSPFPAFLSPLPTEDS
jgi:hypothetical protein